LKNEIHTPNSWAHLPPDLAKQLTLKITFFTQWPPLTHAEGGQVEPVLGSFKDLFPST
jgi:hypothetical protein